MSVRTPSRAAVVIEACEARQLLTYTQVVSPSGSTALADAATTLSYIYVPQVEANLTDLDVVLNIGHTRDSDLTVYLTGPTGKRVKLLGGVGGTGQNFTGSVLDDDATTSIASGSAPFSNRFKPAEALSAFNGLNPQGVWKLDVVDGVAGSTGTLNSWQLVFKPGVVFTSTPSEFVDGVGIQPGRTLPDLGHVNDDLFMPYLKGVTIQDINVGMDITHPFAQDVKAVLQRVKGFEPETLVSAITLTGGGSSYPNGSNYTGTVFDDSAATAITAAAPPYTGSFKPVASISQLGYYGTRGAADEFSSETLRLSLDDVIAGGTGTLNSWYLELRKLQSLALPNGGMKVVDNVGSTTDGLIDFGTSGAASPFAYAQKFTVTNTASFTQNLTFDPPLDGNFSIQADGLGINSDQITQFGLDIPAGGTTDVFVRFQPRSTGAKTATFKMLMGGLSKTVTVRGTANASPIKVTDITGLPFVLDSQNRFDVGAVALGATYTHDMLVTNISAASLSLSTINFEIPVDGAFEANPNAWSFNSSFVNPPADGLLKPGASVIKRITFITDSDYVGDRGNSGSAGSGGNTVIQDVPFISDTIVPMNVTDNDAVTRDMCLSFADAPPNTATPQTLRYSLKNTDSNSLTIQNFAKLGTNAGEFTTVIKTDAGATITGTSFTLPAGKTYTIDVTFKPTAAGPRSARLQFNCVTATFGSPLMTLKLAGNGIGPPAAPTGVATRPISSTRVDIAWTDASTNEAGFVVQRSTDNITFADVSPGLAAGVIKFSDTAALPAKRYYYRVRAFNAAGVSASASVATTTPAKGTTSARVRAAGTTGFNTSTGLSFSPAAGFTGGTATGATFPVANTVDDLLYSNYRQGTSFSFSRAVTNGAYLLKLYFAEPTTTNTSGKRKFNIVAEGKTLYSNYDVAAMAGGVQKAIVFSQNVIVADGALSLTLTGTLGQAILSAIEVVPA
jgi:subtilisin-like proprotein convertase family protein